MSATKSWKTDRDTHLAGKDGAKAREAHEWRGVLTIEFSGLCAQDSQYIHVAETARTWVFYLISFMDEKIGGIEKSSH